MEWEAKFKTTKSRTTDVSKHFITASIKMAKNELYDSFNFEFIFHFLEII